MSTIRPQRSKNSAAPRSPGKASLVASTEELISSQKLREVYVKGVFRNAMFLLTAAHPEADTFFDSTEEPTERSRANRGSVSYDLLVYLFQQTTLRTLLQRFLLSSFKSVKQGNATLHDLGLAHCLFHLVDFAVNGGTDRSLTVTRTQSMGRIIGPLRTLTAAVYSQLSPDELAELTDDQIRHSCPAETQALEPTLKSALSLTSKFRRTQRRKNKQTTIDPDQIQRDPDTDFAQWFTLTRLVKFFALLKEIGLDARPVDEFLKDQS